MRIQVVELLKRTSVFLFFFLVGRKGTRRLSSSMSDMVLSAVRSFDRWQQQRRRRWRHGYSGRTRTTSMQPGESITEVDLTATADMLSSIKITFKFSLQHLRRKKTETFESWCVFFSRFNDGVDNFFGTDTDADVEISPIEVFPAKVSSLLNSALPLNNSSGNK